MSRERGGASGQRAVFGEPGAIHARRVRPSRFALVFKARLIFNAWVCTTEHSIRQDHRPPTSTTVRSTATSRSLRTLCMGVLPHLVVVSSARLCVVVQLDGGALYVEEVLLSHA